MARRFFRLSVWIAAALLAADIASQMTAIGVLCSKAEAASRRVQHVSSNASSKKAVRYYRAPSRRQKVQGSSSGDADVYDNYRAGFEPTTFFRLREAFQLPSE